jgi:CheY-like chemotaxis protein
MARAMRILLAEDNPGDVFLVKKALKRHLAVEHELVVANDGDAAWKLIESAEGTPPAGFDLFIIDLNLPVRPGLEVLARIRRCRGKMSRAIVLVVTSSSSVPDREAARRADYYFCKPSDLESFLKLGVVVRDLWNVQVEEKTSKTKRRAGRGRGMIS